MVGVNRVIVVGNLGADPELHQGGTTSRCNFRVAVSERWTGKDGQKQERTEWVPVVAWGKKAELCAQYLRKGSKACVEGKLQTRSWDDGGQKRYMTEVVADEVHFLDRAPERNTSPDEQKSRSGAAAW